MDVTQTAQKGAVTVAGAAGASILDNDTNLAAAETLTITPAGGSSVQVVLSAGMTNAQVAAGINEKSSQTGVTASLDGANGGLRLATQQFGKNFTLTSSAAGGAGTTGLTATDTGAGTGPGTVTVGRNVVATVTNGGDSVAGTVGIGDTITFVTGVFNGLSVRFSAAAGGLATSALTNGVVNVSNNSLVFQIGANAGQTASVAMDKADSASLGTGVAGVASGSLRELNVTTTSGSQDALKVVDQAIKRGDDTPRPVRRLPAEHAGIAVQQLTDDAREHHGGRVHHPRHRFRHGNGDVHEEPGAHAGRHLGAEQRQPTAAAGPGAAARLRAG